MCIVFTCGEHTFRKAVEGYEGIVCRCYNCGNTSGHVIKSHPWFTFCFVVSLRDCVTRFSPASLLTYGCTLPADNTLYHPRLRGRGVPDLQLRAAPGAQTGRPGHAARRGHRRAAAATRGPAASRRWTSACRSKAQRSDEIRVRRDDLNLTANWLVMGWVDGKSERDGVSRRICLDLLKVAGPLRSVAWLLLCCVLPLPGPSACM